MRSSRRAPVSARPSPICCPCCCSNGARSSRPARTRCRTSCSVATCRCSAPSSAGRCGLPCSKAAVITCAGTGSTRRGATVRAMRRRSRRSKRSTRGGRRAIPATLRSSRISPTITALRAQVTSTVDNCLGRECEFVERCFVAEARRRAQAAEVVIVNHHLLLADLALKDLGFGELLPGTDAVIVDEAHQLPDVAQQFFGWSVGTRELESLARDAFAGARAAGALTRVDAALSALGRAVVALRVAAVRPEGRTPWIAAPAALRDALPEVAEALEGAWSPTSSRSRSRAPRCATASSAAPRARRGCATSRWPIPAKGCAGSISHQGPSRCIGRRSMSVPRSPRGSKRRTASGCSPPPRSPSARIFRTSWAGSAYARR